MLLRALVILLIAMNVGVAAWWALRTEPQAGAQPATEPAIPSLQLLSEVEPAPADDVAEPVGPPQPPPLQRLCMEVGPFLTQADLRRAVNALTPAASRIQFRESRAVIRRGFRVFIPATRDRETALATARQLSARGLRDYYVVTAGEQENTISLGLYRDQGNAQRRRQEVAALGFDVRMEPRNEELPQYWIDLDVAADYDWRSTMGGYAGVGSREIACQ
jgi:hypothetical protein